MPPAPGSRSRRRDAVVTAALCVGVALAVTGASAVGLGATAIRAVGDVLWPSGAADPRVVVVAIDQASLEQVGEWPWTRAQDAALVDAVVGAGAAVVALDVALIGDGGDPDGDAALRGALDGRRAVVVDPLDAVQAGPRWPVAGERLPLADDAVPDDAAPGHSLLGADADGVTRTLAAVVESVDGTLVPSLALQAAALATGGADTPRIAADRIVDGAVVAPLEPGARFRIAWAGGLRTESAAEVLDGAVELDDAVVVIGVTAPGLGDRHATPVSAGVPGAVVHAAAIDTMLRSAWVAPGPPWAAGLAALLGAGVVVPVALRRRLRWLPVALIGVAVAVVAVGFTLFDLLGVLPDLVRPLVGVLAAAGLAVGIRAIREQRARSRVDALFGRYVPDQVAERLLDESAPVPTDERVDVAVLFVDIRGFTPIAEDADPDVVRRSLDVFYDTVCAEVFARDGTVMQFVGDEVFAVFGAPVEQRDAAARALETALALRGPAARALEQRLPAAGLPALGFGIGVHAGPVVAAHVGPERRRQYAVIGDTVNVGSRLCGLAAAGEVVSSVTVDAWPDGVEVRAEHVAVKGHRDALAVVRVTGSAHVPPQGVAVVHDDPAALDAEQPQPLQ